MDVLKDFLISTFFEAALAFPWICLLLVAWVESELFTQAPLATTYKAVRSWAKYILENKLTMQFAVIFVLLSYPLGVIMQRISDEFIETTSIWMPKEIETNQWLFRCWDIKNATGLMKQLRDSNDPVGACVSPSEKKDAHSVADIADLLNKFLKNDRIQVKDGRVWEEVPVTGNIRSDKSIRAKREFLDRKYAGLVGAGNSAWRELIPVSWDPVKRDGDIKDEIQRKYLHLLGSDLEQATNNLELQQSMHKEAKVIRDLRTRRAFGSQESADYMNRLLELVRMCQAAAMHLFLLFYILLSLALFLIVKARRPKAGVLAILILMLVGWNLRVPFFHDEGEFNFPVFVVFLLANTCLFVIARRIWWGPATSLANACLTARGLLVAASIALVLCYFATFSWGEHRENYEESALILGGSTK